MEELISTALRLVERNRKVGKFGELLGPRAVLVMRERDMPAIVVWTDENKVVTIESSSLAHALKFEEPSR
jgi:hypothetical protein